MCSSHLWSLADAILGALAGAGFIYGVGEIYYRARGVGRQWARRWKLMA